MPVRAMMVIMQELMVDNRFWWRDARLSEIPHSHLSAIITSPSTQPTFAYPTTFLPIPYHTPPISLSTYISTIIPSARVTRQVELSLPTAAADDGTMQVDGKAAQDIKITVSIRSDGMLMYVSEASYQPVSAFCYAWTLCHADCLLG